jgi:MFS transporter, FSR family, fosmidomycin resistance protein
MQLSGVLIEAPLLHFTARWPRRELLAASLAGVGASCFGAACVHSYPALLGVLFVFGLAIGMACSVAEAALVDMAPDERERMLGRWSLLSGVGDVGAPLLVGAVAWIGVGWRAAFVVMGLWSLAHAALVRAGPSLPPGHPDEDEEDEAAAGPWWREPGVRAAMGWCLAAGFCSLMDEVLVSFGSLRLEELGATPGERSVVLAAGTLGSIGGLLVAEWAWSRVQPLRLLLGCSVACGVALAAWPAAHWLPLSALLLAATCALEAPLYAVVQAQAFAAMPGRSTRVMAIAAVASGFDLMVPMAIGAVADHWGLRSALASMLLGPLGLTVIAAVSLGRRRRGESAQS